MSNLTGKGKPFYSALDKAAALLKRKVGTGQEFMQELKGLGGIKQAEMDERKLGEVMGMPKMTHEQFMANLATRPLPAINEKVLGGEPDKNMVEAIAREIAYEQAMEELRDDGMSRSTAEEVATDMAAENFHEYLNEARRDLGDSGATYHEKYTLPGGENYREMLIKAPKGSEEFGGVGAHFGGEPNILASMRVKDRTGLNGEKLLHLEELQSDWHQKGREKGYNKDVTELPEGYTVQQSPKGNYYRVMDLQGNLFSSGMSPETATANAIDNLRRSGVPDAPFKKNWEEMALKRLVHHAAENGYHGIVVTPGAEQADRYSLAKQVDRIAWQKQPDNTFSIQAIKGEDEHNSNEVLSKDKLSGEQLAELIGKEAASKINENSNQQPMGTLSGLDLQMGGEGMKGFYDKKVPNILNTIGKKHGVKVGKIQVPVKHELQGLRTMGGYKDQPPLDVHHFPITEDMRKDILTNGLPLYKEGGIIRKAEGGNVQLSVEQMRQQLMNAGRPMGDLSQIGAQEAPNMPVKNFVTLQNGAQGSMPMGGVDMSPMQPGQQMMPANALQPNPLMPQQPDQQQGGAPLGGMPPPPPAGGSNILQMTPQGQAMAAMKPPMQKADGGMVGLPMTFKIRGSDNMPMNNDYSDNGATNYNMDNIQQLAMGGGVQGYASKGYVTHTPSKPHPVVGTRFKSVPQGNLVKEIPFNFEDYENKGSIINSPYDATTRDNLVSEISGYNLVNPLLTEAGFRYSMDPSHVQQNIGGASNLGIAGRQQGRVDQAFQEHGGDVFMMPSTMSDSEKVKDYPENFSHHPAHILLDLMKQRQFNKKILKEISDDLRAQHELVEDKKTGKKVKAYPYKNFIGFDHPMAEDQLINGGYGLDTTAGNLRKKMVERLGSVGMQKMLDYNIGDLRGAILDPDLATDPKGFMGAVVVKAKPNAALRQSKHTAYDTDLYGMYEGGFKNRPIEIVQPDVFSTIDKELRSMPKNTGKSEASIRAQVIGAIEKRKEKIAQPINSRVVTNAGMYEEGLKQGEFDPKNLESILRYYKRKGGYKKGGGVKAAKLTDNLDTMRLALTRNKKAK